MTAEAAYGLALLLTCAVAICAPPPDRAPAVLSGLLITTSWALYNAPWHGWGIAKSTGMSFPDAWSLEDTLIAAALVATYLAHRRKWVWAIIGLMGYQVVNYQIFAWYGKPSWNAVEGSLDLAFVAQLAIIATVGGEGVGDVLDRCLGHLRRHVCHPTRAA